MKKIFLILFLIINMPVFAVCKIGNGKNICSTETQNNPSTPLFQTQNIGVNGKNTINKSLQPSGLNNTFQQNQNKNGVDINSSLGCQFGNCNQGLNNPFLKNQ